MQRLSACCSRQLEKLISKNYYLHQSAKDGYRAYIQSYASYSLKKIFNVHELDLKKVGKAFGFPTPPAVSLPVRGSHQEGESFSFEAIDQAFCLRLTTCLLGVFTQRTTS